ncbi:KGG domain-containing protein [Methylorubrum podarium]|uniref:KGG domain-containing protein n=1 Tax=Methylorubrum podarium TaxID=200476 RepID=A0ABV1QT56_9HYPH
MHRDVIGFEKRPSEKAREAGRQSSRRRSAPPTPT